MVHTTRAEKLGPYVYLWKWYVRWVQLVSGPLRTSLGRVETAIAPDGKRLVYKELTPDTAADLKLLWSGRHAAKRAAP